MVYIPDEIFFEGVTASEISKSSMLRPTQASTKGGLTGWGRSSPSTSASPSAAFPRACRSRRPSGWPSPAAPRRSSSTSRGRPGSGDAPADHAHDFGRCGRARHHRPGFLPQPPGAGGHLRPRGHHAPGKDASGAVSVGAPGQHGQGAAGHGAAPAGGIAGGAPNRWWAGCRP